MSETPNGDNANPLKRVGINLGAFVLVFLFVWIVFDNLALALLFALVFAGGGEAVQRLNRSKDKTPDDHSD